MNSDVKVRIDMSWRCGYGHSGRVFDVNLSPAGDCLLSASEDGSARVWSLVSETVTQKACVAGHKAEVIRASWKQDQTMIATGASLRVRAVHAVALERLNSIRSTIAQVLPTPPR